MTAAPAHRIGLADAHRSARRGLVQIVGAIAMLGLIGGLAYGIGRQNLDQAIEDRTTERAALVERFSLAGDELYDPTATVGLIAEVPFVDDVDPLNAALLDLFQLNPASDPLAGVALVRADGTVLASRPTGLLLDPSVLGPALDRAIAGDPSLTPVFRLGPDVAWARVFAVGATDPWGALVMVEGLDDGWLQRLYRDLGSLGRASGGLTLVDRNGVAAASWNAELLGTEVLTPARVAALGDTAQVWTQRIDDADVVHIGVSRHGAHEGTALVFHQAEADFVRDLRQAQRQRDLVLMAMLVTAVSVLALFSAQRQRAIRRAERRAEVVLAASDDIIAVVDLDGSIRSVSSGLERLLGHRPRAWHGRHLGDLVAAEHRPEVADALRRAADRGQAASLGIPLLDAEGRQRWFDLTLVDRRDDERVGGVVATCSEVEDRKSLEDALAHQASHDPLTGLSNRGEFDGALAARLDRGVDLVVGVVDLDRFKSLNDQLGHDAGDDALRAVASVLRTHVERVGRVARRGGDEFAFWVEGFSDDQLDAMCRGLVTSIEAIWPGGAIGPNLSASIGLARARPGVSAASSLLREADRAMYQAKAAGGGLHRHADRAEPVAGGDAPPAIDRRQASGPIAVHHADISPPPVARRRRWTAQRRRDALSLAIVAAMLLVFAGVSAGLGDQALRSSERERIEDRVALLGSLAGITASTTSPARLTPLAAQIPWDPANPEATTYVLDQWVAAPALGRHAVVILLDREGAPLAAAPRGARLPAAATTDGPHWAAVLEGRPWIPPMIADDDGRLRHVWVIPVVELNEVVRVLVVGASVRDTNWSDVLAQVGSLGAAPGGAESIDSNGVVSSSWDPSRVGEPAIDPAVLSEVSPEGSLELVTVGDGGEHLTLAVAIPDPHSERYMLWQEASDDLFADLRTGQRTRDAALAGSVGFAIVGLAMANRRRERIARLQNGQLHALLQRSTTIVAIIDPRGVMSFVSSAAGGHTGYERRQLEGQPLERLFGPAARLVRDAIEDAVPGSEGRLRGVAIPDSTGAERVFDVGIVNLEGHPAVTGTLVTLRDRTDRQALEDRLRDQAMHDALTGLPNRSEFAREIETLDAETGTYAVVFVDLDHFKPVNDVHGHQVGDEVLKVVATRLSAGVRDGDLVARHGGDEFTILLRGCDLDDAEAMTERLLDELRRPIRVGSLEVQIGASAGVVAGTSEGGRVGHLLRTADQAMYRAKRAGRNQLVTGATTQPV